LSGRTSEFSRQIRTHMSQVDQSVTETERAIDEVASQDMDFALKSNQQVEDMMRETHEVNAAMAEAVRELAVNTTGIGAHGHTAVTTLQFQDLVTQLLGHVKRRVDALDGVSDRVGAVAADLAAGRPAPEAAGAGTLSELCRQLNELLEDVRRTTVKNPVAQG